MADLLGYNIDNGALEAMVHGWKSGILRAEDYANLTQCESLEDVKMHLQATDYGSFLQNEQRLTARVIMDRALDTLVANFYEIRDECVQPLAKFLDFISFEYMIQNVLKLMLGARHGKDSVDLLVSCHPLGMFEGISALTAAATVDELWAFLIDTPLGPFFERGTARQDFDDKSIEVIRGLLMRNYLEAFYDFVVEELGGTTAEVMAEILEFEADRAVITIVRNTQEVRDFTRDDKVALFPRIGRLVGMHEELAACEDLDQLRTRLSKYSDLADLVEGDRSGGDVDADESLDRKFQQRAIEMHKASLGKQMHFGVFYSWFKLKEIEVANLMLISECIAQGVREKISGYTPIY